MKKAMPWIFASVLLLCLGGLLYGCWKAYGDISRLRAEKESPKEAKSQTEESPKEAKSQAEESPKEAESQAEESPKEAKSQAEENPQEEENQAGESLEDESQAQEQQVSAQWEMQGIYTAVQEMTAGFGDGDWAVYVKDLTGGGSFEINSHQMESASLIKLYIMGTVWQAIEDGALSYTSDIQDLLTQMITVSDNEASNRLVEALSPSGVDHPQGRVEVNSFSAANGFADTNQGRDLKDFRAVEPVEKNYTSVRDCGIFLEKVYREQCVSPEASGQMLELLKMQQRREKIPGGLPEGVVTANKTGEVSTMEHDAAIVYGPGRDYVLCVMSAGLTDTETARQHIRDISATVYAGFAGLQPIHSDSNQSGNHNQ